MTSHTVFGDKVQIYRRAQSSLWQCSTYSEGREWRVSTKTDSLALAKEFAEDWYLPGQKPGGPVEAGKNLCRRGQAVRSGICAAHQWRA
ncbi:hypothetical protein ACFYE9_17955 [Rhizobium leguminosarum]|uniref:hypothetical protein n=1 Tax=Rhizobium leguminosarum TaxID=384 RepID=UPI0036DCED5F